MTEEQLNEQNLSLSGLGNTGEIIDEKTKKQLQNRKQAIQDQLSDAEEFGDREKQIELEEELEKIEQYLAGALGLRGRIRRSSDPIEKIRKTVSTAIKRTCDTFLQDCPELGRHLKNSLETGTSCIYKPKDFVDWVFS